MFALPSCFAGNPIDELDQIRALLVRAIDAQERGNRDLATALLVDINADLTRYTVKSGHLPSKGKGYAEIESLARTALPRFRVIHDFGHDDAPPGWDEGPWQCGLGGYGLLCDLSGEPERALEVFQTQFDTFCSCHADSYYRCHRLASALYLRRGQYDQAFNVIERQRFLRLNGSREDRDDEQFLRVGYLSEKFLDTDEAVLAYKKVLALTTDEKSRAIASSRLSSLGIEYAPGIEDLEAYLEDQALADLAVIAAGRQKFSGSFQFILGVFRDCIEGTMFPHVLMESCLRAFAELGDERAVRVIETALMEYPEKVSLQRDGRLALFRLGKLGRLFEFLDSLDPSTPLGRRLVALSVSWADYPWGWDYDLRQFIGGGPFISRSQLETGFQGLKAWREWAQSAVIGCTPGDNPRKP